MAGLVTINAVVKALALLSCRDIRSLGSIAGQNFFLFLLLIALQPESAAFFVLLLLAVLFFPLATDPMQKIPAERRQLWPIFSWEWAVIRIVSVLLSPVAWLAGALLVWTGWGAALLLLIAGVLFFSLKFWASRWAGRFSKRSTLRLPAPPGAIGAIARLQWREMLRTLDPYVAFALMCSTALYRLFCKPLDPAAPRMMALVVALALSTEAQVLFGLDGPGVERYRLLPICGWRILLAKDLAFLLLLGLLVLPLDFFGGMAGGLAALTVGHHNSVFKIVPQAPWRFTSGALFPHGALQTVALFVVGFQVRSEALPIAAACLFAWIASVVFYGWQWDRVSHSHS